MRVQHNITAMNSYRNYNTNASVINKNIEKLSSGYKINRAGDDAAGLAISEKMRAQITGLEGAQKNAKDGISLVQTAEGALTEVHSMLNRMYSLAEQSANGTYDSKVDRNQLQKEVESLRTEIDRVADSANFNGIQLLNGVQSATVAKKGYVVDDTKQLLGAASFSIDDKTSGKDTYKEVLGIISGKQVSVTLKANQTDTTSATWDTTSISTDLTAAGYTITASADTLTVKKGTDDIAEMKITTSAASGSQWLTNAAGTGLKEDVTVNLDLFGDTKALTLQVGDTADKFNQMDIGVDSIKSYMLGAYNTDSDGNKTIADDRKSIAYVDISTADKAAEAMSVIKSAINYVSDTRGGLGAIQNRLEHTINNLSVMQTNIQDAESTIRDTDVADEMMKYTKNSILVQSAQAMLAQANQQPQGVLQLLQ